MCVCVLLFVNSLPVGHRSYREDHLHISNSCPSDYTFFVVSEKVGIPV